MKRLSLPSVIEAEPDGYGVSSPQLWRRAICALAAAAVCLGLAGCGSSSTPSPPSPPAPLGHAYVTTTGNLYGYAITASNGALTSITAPSGAPGGSAIVANAEKDLLYTLTSAGQIYGYSIDTNTGGLTAITGSPWGGAGVGGAFLTVDVAGQYLFVPAKQDLTVVPYTIGAGGALTIGLQVKTPGAPLTTTVDPTSHFLYVPMGSTGTEIYQITNGALTDLGTTAPVGQTKPQFVAITPSDSFAYISDGVSSVDAYAVNSTTGSLTALPGSPYAAGRGPSVMAMTPNGNFLYVANSQALLPFAINSDGSLSAVGTPVSFATPPLVLSIDVTGAYLYVLSLDSTTVAIYKIDSATGALTSSASAAVASGPTGIATTP